MAARVPSLPVQWHTKPGGGVASKKLRGPCVVLLQIRGTSQGLSNSGRICGHRQGGPGSFQAGRGVASPDAS